MEPDRPALRDGGKGAGRAIEDLRRAARVLGLADEDFTRILSAAQGAGGADAGDPYLVEQVKKQLARQFHTR